MAYQDEIPTATVRLALIGFRQPGSHHVTICDAENPQFLELLLHVRGTCRGEIYRLLRPVEVNATVKMDKTDAGMTVVSSHLDLVAKIPGASQEAFETAANNAKAGCPISRLLNCEISLEATLEN